MAAEKSVLLVQRPAGGLAERDLYLGHLADRDPLGDKHALRIAGESSSTDAASLAGGSCGSP